MVNDIVTDLKNQDYENSMGSDDDEDFNPDDFSDMNF